jgi:hypothetical protein
MTVRLGESAIELIGVCDVGEVEALVALLESRPGWAVDIGGATRIHTALWQALMVYRSPLAGESAPELLPQAILRGLRPHLDDSRKS